MNDGIAAIMKQSLQITMMGGPVCQERKIRQADPIALEPPDDLNMTAICGSTEHSYSTEGLTLIAECIGCNNRQEIALTSEQIGAFLRGLHIEHENTQR